ncbi:uncharacterized protein SPPG_04057 [Spizellomyces punctatus DAOM BR117]|uniref:Arrestin C-terminal-like domain-containing protein n=1 Tax=Spizellomyces punctatus (strain DAOM BR117) TaxID=645134 RepID=A0A0L0HIK8_SPIPD|nr:uncharacterized protein SPPG_04057 [Spizellomyces punctatus DAOM BR117]KND00957.1 hypothetical protein SPPG_04057 [Spizellomyces punctatus DAOM BR117]|eukprot:XP_016608996.1 hypothetical protein SPPG_04057 [Spizellomyces punctatus DAOM BR117]
MGGPRLSVQLERGRTPHFAGEIMKGRVILDWQKGGPVKYVRLRCVGAVQLTGKAKPDLAEIIRTLDAAERTRLLMYYEKIIWGKRANTNTLGENIFDVATMPSGKQIFPFEFPLVRKDPGMELVLPSSFQNWKIAIVYFVHVEIVRPWPRKDYSSFYPFHVACLNDTNDPLYHQPQAITRGIDVGLLGLFLKGTIEARVSIPRKAYCKGDTIPIRLEINHMGNVKHVTGVHISLVRYIRWRYPTRGMGYAVDPFIPHSTFSPAKVARIRHVYEPLDIAPGDVDVDLTVDYFIDPIRRERGTKKKATLNPDTPLALHYSDDFPWSSLGRDDDVVRVSYELQVQLRIGRSDARSMNKSVDDDTASLEHLPNGKSDEMGSSDEEKRKVDHVVKSLADGMLSGGRKSLEFSFPIVIGTIPLRETLAEPPRRPSTRSTVRTNRSRSTSVPRRRRRNTISGGSDRMSLSSRPSTQNSSTSTESRPRASSEIKGQLSIKTQRQNTSSPLPSRHPSSASASSSALHLLPPRPIPRSFAPTSPSLDNIMSASTDTSNVSSPSICAHCSSHMRTTSNGSIRSCSGESTSPSTPSPSAPPAHLVLTPPPDKNAYALAAEQSSVRSTGSTYQNPTASSSAVHRDASTNGTRGVDAIDEPWLPVEPPPPYSEYS